MGVCRQRDASGGWHQPNLSSLDAYDDVGDGGRLQLLAYILAIAPARHTDHW